MDFVGAHNASCPDMYFVDKNPYGDNDVPLEDETEWEHRYVTNVTWFRRTGYALTTAIRGATMDDQSHETYFINESLLEMIRDSPHNTKLMASQLAAAATTAAAAPAEGASDAASATAGIVGSV